MESLVNNGVLSLTAIIIDIGALFCPVMLSLSRVCNYC